MPRRSFGEILRRRRPDGSLLPRWYVRWRADGRVHQRAAGLTRASAEAMLDAVEGAIRAAAPPPASPGEGAVRRHRDADSGRTLAFYAPSILRHWSAVLSKGTLRGRPGCMGRWARRLGRRPVHALTRADVETAVREMAEQGLAASTINVEVACLSSAFEVLRGPLRVPLPGNPGRGIRLPRVHQEVRPYLPTADLERLLAACSPAARGPATLLAEAGLRPGEALDLRWGEVALDLQSVRLRRTKTARGRVVPLAPRALRVLQEARAALPAPPGPEDRVFPATESRIRKDLRAAARATGIEGFAPYTLRHSFAGEAVRAGVSPAVLRDVLGHSSLTTTDRYLRSFSPDAARQAIDALARARGEAPLVPAPAAGDLLQAERRAAESGRERKGARRAVKPRSATRRRRGRPG